MGAVQCHVHFEPHTVIDDTCSHDIMFDSNNYCNDNRRMVSTHSTITTISAVEQKAPFMGKVVCLRGRITVATWSSHTS